jgi:hypothetical protein
VSDLETAITATVERAVQGALERALQDFRTPSATSGDDEVLGVGSLAKYLGMGTRQTYALVNCDPPEFPVKRVGTRILVLRGVVRRWLEAGGHARIAPMQLEARRSLERRARGAR